MAGYQGSAYGHGGHQGPPPVSAGGEQGYPRPGHGGPGPVVHHQEGGELVTVVSEANPNYRLTSRQDGVVLVYKNQQDPTQYWIKLDYGEKFIDEEGARAFVLVSKSTGYALSHGSESGAAVTQEPYRPEAIDNSILWSQGKDLGKGFCAIRLVTNIHLNLDADHGDKKHGGIQQDNRLVVHAWNKQVKQKWKIAEVGPED